MKVLKFGGSSVSTPTNLETIVSILQRGQQHHDIAAIVVSALSGVTDLLLQATRHAILDETACDTTVAQLHNIHSRLIKQTLPQTLQPAVLDWVCNCIDEVQCVLRHITNTGVCSAEQKDTVAAYGELLSSHIITTLLQANEVNATFLDAREIMQTDDHFGAAAVDIPTTYALIQKYCFDRSRIYVIPGFIARAKNGATTTLGRGGSDYTASLVGSALHASSIEIWTDVHGVMTADPRMVPNARPLSHLSYEEAMELSRFGAKVIYPPTITPAYRAGIPLCIKNTLNPFFPGTLIHHVPAEHNNALIGIASIPRLSFIRLTHTQCEDMEAISKRLHDALAPYSIMTLHAETSESTSIHTICISPEYAQNVFEALKIAFENKLSDSTAASMQMEDPCTLVTLVLHHQASSRTLLSQVKNLVHHHGIKLLACFKHSDSSSISIVTPQSERHRAMHLLHEHFFEDYQYQTSERAAFSAAS
jgi:aspartokinase/homoserine dehydrogenase 1